MDEALFAAARLSASARSLEVSKYGCTAPSRDFKAWLIESFAENDLRDAEEQFRIQGNCSKVTGPALRIVKERKKVFKSAKAEELAEMLRGCISEYRDYSGNYEQRTRLRTLDDYLRERKKAEIDLASLKRATD